MTKKKITVRIVTTGNPGDFMIDNVYSEAKRAIGRAKNIDIEVPGQSPTVWEFIVDDENTDWQPAFQRAIWMSDGIQVDKEENP